MPGKNVRILIEVDGEPIFGHVFENAQFEMQLRRDAIEGEPEDGWRTISEMGPWLLNISLKEINTKDEEGP